MKKIWINGKEYQYKLIQKTNEFVELSLDGKSFKFNKSELTALAYKNKKTKINHVFLDGEFFDIETKRSHKSSAAGDGQYLSPMPGKILQVSVKVGDKVTQGDSLLIMEAMKMEHTIKATQTGEVKAIHFKAGDQVGAKVELIEVQV